MPAVPVRAVWRVPGTREAGRAACIVRSRAGDAGACDVGVRGAEQGVRDSVGGPAVLFVGPKAATPVRIVERYCCGWQVVPGDAGGLARLLGELAERPEVVWEAGRRAREAFEAHYDLPIGVQRIWEILREGGGTEAAGVIGEESEGGRPDAGAS